MSPVDPVFSDGFETTTLGRWPEGVTDSGDLSVASAAALFGGHGHQAPLDDNTPIYLTGWSPFAERRYRARSHFDTNSISMAPGESHNVLCAYVGDTALGPLRIELGSAPSYQDRLDATTDDASNVSASWYPISDAPISWE